MVIVRVKFLGLRSQSLSRDADRDGFSFRLIIIVLALACCSLLQYLLDCSTCATVATATAPLYQL
jgi:hypothetical protein